MQRIHWTSVYSTGVAQMDSQHQWMMELVNRVLSAFSRKDAPELLSPSLLSLVEYTREHFRDEEALMKSSAYPGQADHKAAHNEHVRWLAHEITGIVKGDRTNLESVRDFLKTWLINHILEEDKKTAAYILENAPHLVDRPAPSASDRTPVVVRKSGRVH